MIQSEHILEYIDGQLDSESEQELFDALAHQPELRSALRQFISIGEAVHADREAYTPPADVERVLMAGLGITAADLGYAATSIGFMARLGAMVGGRLWTMIDAFVLGVVATGLLFYSLMPFGENAAANETTPHGKAIAAGAPASDDGLAATGRGASNDRGASNEQGTAGAPGATIPGASAAGATAPGTTTPGATAAGATSQMPSPASAERNAAGTVVATPMSGSGANLSAPSHEARRTQLAAGVHTLRAPSVASRIHSTHSNVLSSEATRHSTAALTVNGAQAPPNGGTTVDGIVSPQHAPPTSTQPAALAQDRSTSDAAADASQPLLPHVALLQLRRETSAMSLTAPRVELDKQTMPEGVRHNLGATSPLEDVLLEHPDSNGVLLEGRMQTGWSLTTSKARVASGSGRDAFAAGAYWRFGEGFAVGAEGGVEHFDQTLRYRGGDTLEIDQQPQFAWGGLALRYEMTRFSFLSAMPFMQATIGGTSIGPILRYRLGVRFDIAGGFGASLGGELSSLVYEFDHQRMISGRAGLTGGISYTIH